MDLWFGFEHLVCNVWWTSWLVILLWFMFILWLVEGVLIWQKFISYISCILYASISTCRGNSVKIFKFHKYELLVFIKIYKHISRGSSLYSSNLGESIHIIFWNVSRKMSKFFQSSIPSPPYALCVKLTWTHLSLQNLVLSSITKKGEIESI